MKGTVVLIAGAFVGLLAADWAISKGYIPNMGGAVLNTANGARALGVALAIVAARKVL